MRIVQVDHAVIAAAEEGNRLHTSNIEAPAQSPLVLLRFKLSCLQHDEILVDGLQYGVGQPGLSVQETTLSNVEPNELDDRTQRKEVEKFLLVNASLVEVFGSERLCDAQGAAFGTVSDNLLGLKVAIAVMAIKPMVHAFTEREMVQIPRD